MKKHKCEWCASLGRETFLINHPTGRGMVCPHEGCFYDDKNITFEEGCQQKDLLKKCLKEFQYIVNGPTGSIGSLNNVYLPQIDKKELDTLIVEIREFLQNETG